MTKEPLGPLFPHAVRNRMSRFRLFQELQPVGIVLVTRLEFRNERFDRLNINALVTSAVGQEQGFRSDRRLSLLGIDGANELANTRAQRLSLGVLLRPGCGL